MILVDVRVAHDERQRLWLAACDVSDHVGQQRIGSDVERNSQTQIARALIHLTRQTWFLPLTFSASLRSRDEELTKHVAGG